MVYVKYIDSYLVWQQIHNCPCSMQMMLEQQKHMQLGVPAYTVMQGLQKSMRSSGLERVCAHAGTTTIGYSAVLDVSVGIVLI